MNVSSIGGAAALPVPLPPPAQHLAPVSGAEAAPGDVRVPGHRSAEQPAVPGTGSAGTSDAARREEAPKPEPLPPLRGLTLAEVRAMLGMSTPEGCEEESAPQTSASSFRTAMDRYV